ncbi:hypothetical protein PsYK624_099650 [Phanerochaete sordida]|uniref:Uncharacterized protein n=1 Tax=Phanerochaete sordida TaxID=48140 RepID=A0A9P3GF76_9APHY|nr:hypothetical protein PsYK624_099650 [Phanerochaete sordida]
MQQFMDPDVHVRWYGQLRTSAYCAVGRIEDHAEHHHRQGWNTVLRRPHDPPRDSASPCTLSVSHTAPIRHVIYSHRTVPSKCAPGQRGAKRGAYRRAQHLRAIRCSAHRHDRESE